MSDISWLNAPVKHNLGHDLFLARPGAERCQGAVDLI